MSAQPLEIRMAHLEGAYEQINERLRIMDARMETRFDAVDRKFESIDRKFEGLNRKIEGLDKKFGGSQTSVFIAVLGSNAAILAAIIGAIFTLHH